MTTVLRLYLYVYIVDNVKYGNLSTYFDYPIRSDQLIERVNWESILFFKPIPNTNVNVVIRKMLCTVNLRLFLDVLLLNTKIIYHHDLHVNVLQTIFSTKHLLQETMRD